MDTKQSEEIKKNLISDIAKRQEDQIIEESNAKLLIKLIENADDLNEAINIAALGTTYKRTGFHFDKRLEKLSDDIKYFKKNEKLSFTQENIKTKNKSVGAKQCEPVHKLIIGDNYDALQNLLIQYKGKVDVIYIDPPYGKDSMGEFAETNYDNAITRDNLLSMLYNRLILAWELMSDDGVIFCSIDDKNQAYVKCLFDEVFEENNFIAEFVWTNNEGGGGSDSKFVKIKHEYILCYAKKKETVNTKNVDIEDEERYKLEDEYLNERGKYQLVKLSSASIQYSSSLDYEIEMPDKTVVKPVDNTDKNRACWRWSKNKLQWGIEKGFVVYKKDKNGKWQVYTKQYTNCDKDGNIIKRTKIPLALINKFSSTQASNELIEILGDKLFNYPKPVELIKWLIDRNAVCNVILDFFAGSGTTGQAVLELNKEDGGNRQFILCTNNEKTDTTPKGIAYDVTSKRLKRVMTGKCYDNKANFEWIKKNEALGGSLDVYEIESVFNKEKTKGKSAFDVIDETLYGLEKFKNKNDKIKWVCENFEHTQKYLEGK